MVTIWEKRTLKGARLVKSLTVGHFNALYFDPIII